MAAKSGNLNKDGALTFHNNYLNLGVVIISSFHISKTEKGERCSIA